MKKLLAVILAAVLLTQPVLAIERLEGDDITISAPYAVLMESSTGQVIYEKESHAHCSPASVTKVMTVLLVAEAIEAGTISLDTVVTASANAASMGGSQIWLEQGEQMTVGEMLKCVAVVSANDCAVALAELISGTEEAFVQRMNQRAAELGMADTHFTNCTGLLDDDDHYTSAYDIALMSRVLIGHDMIKDYTTIWMDTIRDGEFGLSNTNKLIYYYEGATGLKTGFTSKAMYCLSATAERDGVEYIAVVLHAETSADRFEDAKTLLSYAFANYDLASLRPRQALPPVPVTLGTADSVQPVYAGDEYILEEKGTLSDLTYDLTLAESMAAPVYAGQSLGTLTVYSGETVLAQINIVAAETVERLGFWDIYGSLVGALIGRNAG
ncbi:MAG: D-alanyl-D-alanine carboxypeptidase [Oscillospiraceae bacterium]|nr:D-alanyl-D-alanine carboxypeptidase [Oscillospiraceae bacterium]